MFIISVFAILSAKQDKKKQKQKQNKTSENKRKIPKCEIEFVSFKVGILTENRLGEPN